MWQLVQQAFRFILGHLVSGLNTQTQRRCPQDFLTELPLGADRLPLLTVQALMFQHTLGQQALGPNTQTQPPFPLVKETLLRSQPTGLLLP
jgi:hypothetical protein